MDIWVNRSEDNYKKLKNAVTFEDDGLKIKTSHRNNLIEAKKRAARFKDLDDLENLEAQ